MTKNFHKKFSVKSRIKSFHYAWNGIKIVFKSEPNAILHLLTACLVIGFGFYFRVSTTEWIAISGCIGLVFVAEIFNTAIEYLSDFVSPERREAIKKVKDLSAAAVLTAALTALAIGLLIFVPKFF